MKDKELVGLDKNKLINLGFQNNSPNQNINVNLFNISTNENHLHKSPKVTKKSTTKKAVNLILTKKKDTPQSKLHSQTLKLAWGNLDKNKIINLYEGIMQEYQKKTDQKSPIYKDDKLRREQLGLKTLPASKTKSKKVVSHQQIPIVKKAKPQLTQSTDLHSYVVQKKKNIETLKQTSQKINAQKQTAINKNLKKLYQRQSELIQKSPKQEVKPTSSLQNYYKKAKSPTKNNSNHSPMSNKSPISKQSLYQTSLNPSMINQDIIQKSFYSTEQLSLQSIHLENAKKNLNDKNNQIKSQIQIQSHNDKSPIRSELKCKSSKKSPIQQKSPQQKSPQQKSPQQKSPQQKSPQQKSPLQKSQQQISQQQISPQQKSPIQYQTQQKSPNDKCSYSTGYDLNHSNNVYRNDSSSGLNQQSQKVIMRSESFKLNLEKQVIKQQQELIELQFTQHSNNVNRFEDIANEVEKILVESIEDIIQSVIAQNQQLDDSLQCADEELPEDQKQLEILHQVAIIIQKNWRGFHTRKLLREYFEQLYLESQQNFHQQNMVGLNKSQQYLYQQTSQNLIIFEDEKEDQSETNTNLSKIKKIPNQSKIIDEDEDNDKYFRNSTELPLDTVNRITGSNKLHSLHEKHKPDIKIQHESLILNNDHQENIYKNKMMESQDNKRIQQLNLIQNNISQQLKKKDDPFLINLLKLIEVLKFENGDVQFSILESIKVEPDNEQEDQQECEQEDQQECEYELNSLNQVLLEKQNNDILMKKILEQSSLEIKQQFDFTKIKQPQEYLQALRLALEAADNKLKLEDYEDRRMINVAESAQDSNSVDDQVDMITDLILDNLIGEFDCSQRQKAKIQNSIQMPVVNVKALDVLLNKLALIFQDYFNELPKQQDDQKLKMLYLHNSDSKTITPYRIISQLVKNRLFANSQKQSKNYWLILNMIDLAIQQLKINIPYENHSKQTIDFNHIYQELNQFQNQVLELSYYHYSRDQNSIKQPNPIKKNNCLSSEEQTNQKVEQISDLIYQDLIQQQIHYSIKINKANSIYNQIINETILQEIPF